MNASDINYALKDRLGKYVNFLGAFPRDHLNKYVIPSYREKHIAIIYNTLDIKSRWKMGHWISIVISRSPCKQIFWFDSAGLSPEHHSKDFMNFFLRNSEFNRFNWCRRLQPLYSRKCGLYNLYWIREISLYDLTQGLSRIITFFANKNRDTNDKKVLAYYLKHLNARSCTYLLHIFKSKHIAKSCVM